MYTPLYNKTNYSLLSSLLTIDDLINLAKNKNLLSLGICDNNMFGTMEFINKCTTSNIHPVIGLEMNITNTIILGFAKNYEGYQNLLKLSTLMSKNPLTINDLKTYQNNIIFILPNAHVTTFNDFSIILNDLYAGYDSKDSLNE
ncbi:MAG: PHP domain-containing protein, partial [Bacilli bacterium]